MSWNALEICLKCQKLIVDNSNRIKCDNGLCGRFCHRKCSELSEDQLKMLDTVPNFSWKCDNCLGKVKSGAKMSQWLEKSLREHEKRLEILEQGLEKRSKLEDPVAPPICPFLPTSIGRRALIATVAFACLTILLFVILATTTNLFGKTLNQTEDVVDDKSLVILKVPDWGGRPAKHKLAEQVLPINRVVISHTAAEGCESREVCSQRVKVVQSFHMDSWDWDHVGYNFLVGGDGRVYEGRGWDYVGAHTKGYNTGSVGISFIGTFTKTIPNERQLKACQLLLEEGVRLKKLSPNYRLYGHRQLSATESPGEELYKIIQKWPHWSHEI
ncbi:peptidoglycan-recognition protein SC1a/b isoform X8 [Drosophila ficusphila]|uniref:peptidoglycan-recognition protein SC1a/b isoform X8 n=1 Tax=Drosophila ficusphila TaxID=30025 RepID=UPI0007E5C55E|nr:peptidoglycan-recognition protein SC1a/b isoform X8 [Drosophila ficusphila]